MAFETSKNPSKYIEKMKSISIYSPLLSWFPFKWLRPFDNKNICEFLFPSNVCFDKMINVAKKHRGQTTLMQIGYPTFPTVNRS